MRRILSSALFAVVLALPLTGEKLRSDNVVATRGGAAELLIPAAGSVAGSNGTFFHSEINLLNYTARSQRVRLRWLPQGQTSSAVTELTIAPFSGLSSDDFVANILRQSGLGAILVTAVTADGLNVDGTARLYATDRIWTPQPGSAGTVSQTFSVVQTVEINSGRALSLIGLRREEQFRLNVGIVNLASTPQSFQLTIAGSTPTLIPETAMLTVPAMSMQQFNLPGVAQKNLQVVINNVTEQATLSTRWIAYGSSVDNITGDSWSELAFTPSIDSAP